MPLRTVGTVLGILPGIQLHSARAHFDPGDYLVLYTDGVTEAHDQALEEFGEQRLLAEITSQDGVSVRAILRRIRAAVQAFVGDAPQSDDLTLMVVGRAAAGGDSISQGGSYGRDPDFHHV